MMKKLLFILSTGVLAGPLLLVLPPTAIQSNKALSTSAQIEPIIVPFDYHWGQSFNGTWSDYLDSSSVYKILDWNSYANSWDNFISKYQKIIFNDSYLQGIINDKLTTNKIEELSTNKIGIWPMKDTQFNFSQEYDGAAAVQFLTINLCIWHDNTTIYFQWNAHEKSRFISTGVTANVSMKGFKFL